MTSDTTTATPLRTAAEIAADAPRPQGLAAAIGAMPDTAPKDRQNPHARYRYASADSIYAHARPHIAAAGLALWQDEVDIQIGETTERGNAVRTARVTYAIALTPDGQAPDIGRAERVTVETVIRGPQSWAALRTFAAKYWLRTKCLLATGDAAEDLDDEPQAQRQSGGRNSGRPAQERPDPRIAVVEVADADVLTAVALGLKEEAGRVQPALRDAVRQRIAALGVRWDADVERYVDAADEEQEAPPVEDEDQRPAEEQAGTSDEIPF